MEKEAKDTVGGWRKNWVFSNLIVPCIYLMQLEGVWILDFECLECVALRGKNSIKQPKTHIFQRDQIGKE